MENLIKSIENPRVHEDAERMLRQLLDCNPTEPTLESLQLEAQIWRLILRHGSGTKDLTSRCSAALKFLQGLSKLRSIFMEQEKLEDLKEVVDDLMNEHTLLQDVLEQVLPQHELKKIKKTMELRLGK
jgi:hypothetical protein